MHIPDGYLSPQTYLPLYGVFAVAVTVAVRKVKKEVSARDIPYLGMAAAFSFIIMMFNLPIPGGTTGHAVGSAVIAILFGPWAAIVAVSVALIILCILSIQTFQQKLCNKNTSFFCSIYFRISESGNGCYPHGN